MEYYESIKSLSEILEMWRLPKDLPQKYVMDDTRKIAIQKAKNAIKNGKNVLIVGKIGVGKTAFAAILMRELIGKGISCGVLVYGANLRKDHEDKGMIIFIDDIDEYGINTIKAIIKMNIKNIVATIDIEKMRRIESEIGTRFSQYFEIVYLPPMKEDDIIESIESIESKTKIEISTEDAKILAQKSGGIPLYVFQAIEILKNLGIERVEREHIEKLPSSIQELTEYSLWNYLDSLPPAEKEVAILILLTMGDVPENMLHEDIIYSLYHIYSKERGAKEMPIYDLILRVDLEKKFPFLVRVKKYYLGVPHDVWLEAIRNSKRRDLTLLQSSYKKQDRIIKLKEAINIAKREIENRIKDAERLRALEEQTKRILDLIPKPITPQPPPKKIVIPRVYIDNRYLTPVEVPPLEEFLTSLIKMSESLLSESFRELLALVFADFIKAKKLMMIPIKTKTETINILIKAKLENKLDETSKKMLLEHSEISTIFAEELAILKYGYGFSIDISNIEDKINYSRVSSRLLVLGISAADIIDMFLEKLSIDAIIELAIRARYKEKRDISELAKSIKNRDPKKAIILAAVSTNEPQKIDRLWEKIETSVKLLFWKLLYQSLLADNLDRQIAVLGEAASLSCEEVIEFIENLIEINYYRMGFHNKDLLEYCLGLTEIYKQCRNKIKISIAKKIVDTQNILLAKKIINEISTDRKTIKKEFLSLSRILGRMRDSLKLREIIETLSETKRYKALEHAIINSI